ncbi:hypothetical protein JY651_01435 [Pyxidicoccus parkwayensis]|uniref:Lipoprotein n=1 Tax=Pyxidicoccus parkwayensis TaxID=2813578 RepID=A0ABX7NZ13_9BACT|nr:hypothetical protein [Pyxidicoccus parkwaysis]QSQ23676.1 hypothetical protein JY651_01435 [Pyxidicoccus parkwaysis]
MYRITRAAGLCLALAALALAGCSGSLRHNYMRDEASRHVYQKELAEIWPVVHQVLKERGLSWRENPGRFVLETEWRESGGGTLGPTTSSRFLVEGVRVASGVALRVTRLDRTQQAIGVGYTDGVVRNSREAAAASESSTASGKLPTENRSSRDLELELVLLQRIDPEGAAKLEADAKRAHP